MLLCLDDAQLLCSSSFFTEKDVVSRFPPLSCVIEDFGKRSIGSTIAAAPVKVTKVVRVYLKICSVILLEAVGDLLDAHHVGADVLAVLAVTLCQGQLVDFVA